jgi:hypothetical protein
MSLGYVGISDAYTDYNYDYQHKTRPKRGSNESPTWLQQILAHEADHLLGLVHTTDDQTTPFSTVCGGV